MNKILNDVKYEISDYLDLNDRHTFMGYVSFTILIDSEVEKMYKNSSGELTHLAYGMDIKPYLTHSAALTFLIKKWDNEDNQIF